MNSDLRLFEYALEPILQRSQWRLEGHQASLGRAQAEVGRAAEALATLRHRHAEESRRLAPGQSALIDPLIQGQRVRWLTALAGSISDAAEGLKALISEERRLMRLCQVERQRVEVLERHREESLSEFVLEDLRRQAVEADRDWLTRRVSERESIDDCARSQR